MNQQSTASAGLAAIAAELNMPIDLDAAREAAVGMRQAPTADGPERFAPAPKLPDYVQHAAGATRAGMLSAEAIVMEYETAAKEIEKLGEELRAAKARAEEEQSVYAKALEDLTNTAKAFREEAKRVFEHVEAVTTKASEASALCQELRDKIAGMAAPQ